MKTKRERRQHTVESMSSSQPENSNGTHLFTEPLPTTSKMEKPDELLFRCHFIQLSTSRIAALILEEYITALNNMCLQSFLGSHHSLQNVYSQYCHQAFNQSGQFVFCSITRACFDKCINRVKYLSNFFRN